MRKVISAVGRATVEWKRLARAFAVGAASSACLYAYAQAITDPTRPAIADIPAGATADAPAGFALQSVMITPTERVAIISGERVKLGSTYAGARVVRITESEVDLRSSYGTETLRMYPAVAMKPVVSEPITKKPVRKPPSRQYQR